MKELKLEEGDIKKILRPDSSWRRFGRWFRKLVANLVYIAALFVVFFYGLNFSAFWKRVQFDVNAKPTTPTEQPEPAPIIIPEQPDYAPLVEIPKIGVSAPLVLDIAPDKVVEQLANGVVQYQDTAHPGEIGNSVIVGHSSDFPWSTGKYKNVFALLDKLVVGDQIIVSYKKQKLIYSVTGNKVVKPTDLSVLNRTSIPQITLLTCYPVGTTRSRLIVTAQLLSGTTTGTQTTDPNTNSLPRSR